MCLPIFSNKHFLLYIKFSTIVIVLYFYCSQIVIGTRLRLCSPCLFPRPMHNSLHSRIMWHNVREDLFSRIYSSKDSNKCSRITMTLLYYASTINSRQARLRQWRRRFTWTRCVRLARYVLACRHHICNPIGRGE